MSIRRTSYAKDYESDHKSGRGAGRLNHYNPYLTIQDVPSQVPRTRVWLLRFGRIFHVFSHSELTALLQFDWNDSVVEIYEQYSLDPDTTIGISALKNIRHPSYHGLETVMTTDFLVYYEGANESRKVAYQIKATRKESEVPRTVEKLSIEEEFWKSQGVEWHLLIASEFKPVFVKNLCELHQLRNMALDKKSIERAETLWCDISEHADPEMEICGLHCIKNTVGDRILNGYAVAKLLIARKRKSAPIETVPLEKLKVADIGEPA